MNFEEQSSRQYYKLLEFIYLNLNIRSINYRFSSHISLHSDIQCETLSALLTSQNQTYVTIIMFNTCTKYGNCHEARMLYEETRLLHENSRMLHNVIIPDLCHLDYADVSVRKSTTSCDASQILLKLTFPLS